MLQRKRTTQEYLENGSGPKMSMAGIRYSWKKMDATASDRDKWSQVSTVQPKL